MKSVSLTFWKSHDSSKGAKSSRFFSTQHSESSRGFLIYPLLSSLRVWGVKVFPVFFCFLFSPLYALTAVVSRYFFRTSYMMLKRKKEDNSYTREFLWTLFSVNKRTQFTFSFDNVTRNILEYTLFLLDPIYNTVFIRANKVFPRKPRPRALIFYMNLSR